MKKKSFISRLAIAFVPISFLVLWAVWYFSYYYTLYWQEGFAFFCTLPDFTHLQVSLPEDTFKYVGAYLLQFFRNPLYGAAVQAGIATLIVVCLGCCIIRIGKDVRLMWLAYIPIPFFMAGQYADITLERSVQWLGVVVLVTILLMLLSLKKFNFSVPQWFCSQIFVLGIPFLSLGISIHLLKNEDNKYQETNSKIDYHANRYEWKEILQLIPPREAQKDEFKLRYALLALSETGELADRIFGYGIKDYSQFLFYGSEDPFHRNFNALFYQALDMPNEVIHQCYQQSLTSPFGFNFKSLRMLVDTYLKTGNDVLADKYIEVLRHTSFHQEWIEERLGTLELVKAKKKNDIGEEAPFVGNFLETITSLVNQNPTNKKLVDICLCAILTTRNAPYFHQAFHAIGPVLYANGKRIPRHYEEALLLIALRNKEVLSQYTISQESKIKFADFMKLCQSGKVNAAKAKYPDSYWNFVF